MFSSLCLLVSLSTCLICIQIPLYNTHTNSIIDSCKFAKYACEVFYDKQNLNMWKVIFAFFPRNKLDVSYFCFFFVCVKHVINSYECRKWSKFIGVVTLVKLLMFTSKKILLGLCLTQVMGGAASSTNITKRYVDNTFC